RNVRELGAAGPKLIIQKGLKGTLRPKGAVEHTSTHARVCRLNRFSPFVHSARYVQQSPRAHHVRVRPERHHAGVLAGEVAVVPSGVGLANAGGTIDVRRFGSVAVLPPAASAAVGV